MLEGWHAHAFGLARKLDFTVQRNLSCLVYRCSFPGLRVQYQHLAIAVTRDHSIVFSTRVPDHQMTGIGIPGQIVEVDLACLEQLMN